MGATIYYQTSVLSINEHDDFVELTAKNNITQKQYTITADFILDASGFGRA